MTSTEPQYFFIIGAMKAGTTSLYHYLAGHPQLYASPRKEPRVFRDPKPVDRLRREFQDLFAGRGQQPWCFEASTAYTKYPRFKGVPEQVLTVTPEARFVYVVRSPVERAWSQYLHNLAHGRESRTFAVAITDEPQYLDTSRYHLQLEQYLRVFPRNRLLVLVFEEMIKDPAGTVRSVCAFLGVDTAYIPPSATAYNVSAEKRAAPATLRRAQSMGVAGVVPSRVRTWLKRSASPLPSKQEGLPCDIRALAVDALREDTESFFDLIGRRIEPWSDFT